LIFASTYKCLKNQKFEQGDFSIIPIRFEDRLNIMKWRNEQMYHLRQKKVLTTKDQDLYFKKIISTLFDQENPDQILFSFLDKEKCIGYGGLVKIDWVNRNAEISFIIDTDLEEKYFSSHWSVFLKLIQDVAFRDLNLHKIYTYAYDLRSTLFDVLSESGFEKDAILKEHAHYESRFIDVHIDYKINDHIKFIDAKSDDLNITFKWANDPKIRMYAINKSSITEEEHKAWFLNKISSQTCYFFIIEYKSDKIGSFRLDLKEDGVAWISYLLDPSYHGLGLGRKILEKGIEKAEGYPKIQILKAHVFIDNQVSKYLFSDIGFLIESEEENLLTFKKLIQ